MAPLGEFMASPGHSISSSKPRAESPLTVQGTQQGGGTFARATLTWGVLNLFLLCPTGQLLSPCSSAAFRMPSLQCSKHEPAKRKQLCYLYKQIAGGFPEISGGFCTADFFATPKMNPNPCGEL